MATNNFLPFCPTDTGTNLPSQGDYAIDPDRTVGNQPGVAKSKLNNKALRQSNVIASQLAQYLSDKMSTNALDDGNLANILALMWAGHAPQNSGAVENLTLATSVGSSALTIAVKTALNANPSATDQIFVAMRDATLTSGLYTRRSIQSALSMTISSGSTLGQVSGQPSFIWVYLIDNAGTLELAVSHSKYTEDALVSTTAEGGAGAADSATAIYSTTARSNVPIRLIGYILNTQTVAGTWASAGTKLQLLPTQRNMAPTKTVLTVGSGTYNTPAGCTWFKIRAVAAGGGGAGSANGSFNATAGGNGNNTSFGTAFIEVGAGGGGFQAAGAGNPGSGGAGGAGVTSPSGATVFNGGRGGGGSNNGAQSNTVIQTGFGSPSIFGGASGNGGAESGRAPGAGGAGGGGNNQTNHANGAGGGAGAYIEHIVTNPLASYAYTVGAGGAGGNGGTGGVGGGAGADGIIIIEEYYN